MLEHLEALHAFGLATMCSYDRLIDNYWAGGTWISWGEENRETPLRRIDETDAHWEIRCIDGTANMYLFMAAIVQAGLIGLREHYALMEPCNSE